MSTESASTPKFNIKENFPSGTQLAVEASAGTGKTFTLVALATKAVAEGNASASQLLVVTFTRAAAAELRHRLRKRLVDAASALENVETAAADEDGLIRWLATGDGAEVDRRRSRLRIAVTEFDTAVVTTIHGFAMQALAAVGVSAGGDLDARLVDDTEDRVPEVCTDRIVSGALSGIVGRMSKLPTSGPLESKVKVALALPGLDIRPSGDDVVKKGGPTGYWPDDLLMADFTRGALADVHQRRRRAGTMAYDDLLTRMEEALESPSGPTVVSHLRNRFRVVMIDEFQDTDPVQWNVLSKVFGPVGPSRPDLVAFVGDPKQAIYSFRGADVYTYLEAIHGSEAPIRRRLETNWRSDDRALEGVGTFFDGVTFGDDRIDFSRVDVSKDMIGRHLEVDGATISGLDIRVVRPPSAQITEKGKYPAGPAKAAAMTDMAASIHRLLTTGQVRSEDESMRRITARDVAVLVRTGVEAQEVLASLRRVGIPAVLARSGTVLESRAAEQWRWLLEALVRPGDLRRARLAAVSWFGGMAAHEVDAAGDDGLEHFQEKLIELDDVLTTRGPATFVRELLARTSVGERVLTRPDGDRALTDLLHLGELLSSGVGQATAASLLVSLGREEPQDENEQEHDPDREARRVESDEDAVQVMTVWVAKGLEFPVVACPTLWKYGLGPTVYRDPATGRRTMAIASGTGGDAKTRKAAMEAELVGERLRLLYVALTRARHHTMVWWAPSEGAGCHKSALARVLFSRSEGVLDPAAFRPEALSGKVECPGPHATEETLDLLGHLSRRSNGTISVSEADGVVNDVPAPLDDPDERPPLKVNSIGRVLDRRSMRWSFSAIKSREHGESDPLDSTGADSGADDEQLPPDATEGPEIPDPAATAADVSAMAGLPGGPQFGNLVHAVLEHADFTVEDLSAEFAAEIDVEQESRRVGLVPQDTDDGDAAEGRRRLIAGFIETVQTPLGATLDHRPLATFARSDRLDELEFDLLLAGSGDVRLADIGRVLIDELAEADRFRPWASRLAAGELDVDLRGHLTGSIDAVLRVGEPGEHRFVVVDYKSNRLHDRGMQPAAGDYGQDAMTRVMVDSHYTLQALLYLVALHRYLRWRLPDYDPERHLGGSVYLFLRGMAGANTRVLDGVVDGVCEWHPGGRVVTAVSDLLEGASPAVAVPAGSPAGADSEASR